MKTNNFKFVNPTTKKSILDFDENNQMSVVGEFGGKSIITNAIKTPQVSFSNNNICVEINMNC